jgi:hypothetical protein
VHMVPKEQLITLPKYDEIFNRQENVSSNPQPETAAATQHRMYMYVPTQGRGTHKKGAATTGTTNAH